MIEKDKTRRYNEALERARKLQETCDSNAVVGWMEYIFPELKESENKKNIKNLIDELKCSLRAANCQNEACNGGHEKRIALLEWAIGWLEKQGEQYVPSKEMILNVWELGNIWKEITKGICNTEHGTQLDYILKHWTEGEHYIEWFEKQGEQKPIINGILTATNFDKMFQNCNVHKFKVGDWITDGQLTCKVLGITDKSYELHVHNDDYCHFETDVQSVDANYHLWTIQDAKEGDILIASDDSLFIFAKVKDNSAYYHFSLCKSGIGITDDGNHAWETANSCYPTTKKQRDRLFQKMKEYGYEWDKENKELKKIEQKKDINNKLTDFEYSLKHIMEEAIECGDTHNLKADGDMLIRLAQKTTAWSEEDKEMIDKIIDYMQPMPIFFESTKGKSGKEYTKKFVKDATKWLKSLKERYTWKPSDEQIKALKETCDEHWEPDGLDPLYSLLEQLKKLREE